MVKRGNIPRLSKSDRDRLKIRIGKLEKMTGFRGTDDKAEIYSELGQLYKIMGDPRRSRDAYSKSRRFSHYDRDERQRFNPYGENRTQREPVLQGVFYATLRDSIGPFVFFFGFVLIVLLFVNNITGFSINDPMQQSVNILGIFFFFIWILLFFFYLISRKKK